MAEQKLYETPRIEPLTYTAVSKHHVADIVPTAEFSETYDAKELVREFGSPLYVISESMLRALYQDFAASFTEAGIDTVVAYSFKTNYLPAVCSLFFQEGAWAEVVSGMEYTLARKIGVPPDKIIFNGPFKTRKELETALGEGAIVNVDGFDELSLVEQVTSGMGREVGIGMRVNFQHGPQPWTKFGFNSEGEDSQQALEIIASNSRLRLDMVHNHCGTFVLFQDIYAKATDVLIDTARRARDLGLEPYMADVGGGFPSLNQLKPTFDIPGGTNLRDDFLFPYAEAICGRIGQAKESFGGRPTLVLEPGRAVIDSAVQLVSTVVAKKDIPGHGKAVILDAGVNLVPTAYWYDHKLNVPSVKDSQGDLEPVNIYGPLCMQIDVLREQAMLPDIKVGEPLIVANVGAYCQSQSMQFIQPRPATIMLGPDGPEIIQRREKWRDVFAREEIPARLRNDGYDF